MEPQTFWRKNRYRELLWELARSDKTARKAELRERIRITERVLETINVVKLTVK